MPEKNKKLNEEQIQSYWKDYRTIQSAIDRHKLEIKNLEIEQDRLKDSLVNSIPANTAKAGLYHKQTTRSSTKYAVAVTTIRETLVPKTKQAEVDRILEENTTVTYIDRLEEEGIH